MNGLGEISERKPQEMAFPGLIPTSFQLLKRQTSETPPHLTGRPDVSAFRNGRQRRAVEVQREAVRHEPRLADLVPKLLAPQLDQRLDEPASSPKKKKSALGTFSAFESSPAKTKKNPLDMFSAFCSPAKSD